MRIAYLVPKVLYEQKMSRGARTSYPVAVGKQPGVELRMTGIGWPDWRDHESCTANFSRLGWRPDVLWCYKPDDLIGLPQCDALRVVSYNESWWPERKALHEVEAMHADLIVVHHENGVRDFDGCSGQVVHIPHAADVDTFYCPADTVRPIDCLLTGVISDSIYPLRGRFKRLLECRAIPGEIRKHPGYRLQSAAACDAQFQQYAQHLGRAKISLCCTSKYRYSLAKLVESAVAGCVIASDMPDDSVFHETLGSHIIHIDDAWTDRQIAECIQSHLADPVALQQRAAATQRCALESFTLTRYAERILGAMQHAQKAVSEKQPSR